MFNQSDANITGNLIVGNSAGCGGGIFWLVLFGDRGPLLVNNTIADNDSSQESALFADGFDASTEVINNNLIAREGQTAVLCGDFNDLNAPIFRSNDVFSPSGPNYGGICSDQTGVNGNMSVDPQFVDPGAGDYDLDPSSPAIDAGDNQAPELPPTDLDGDACVIDGDGDGDAVVDIGADEFPGGAPSAHVVIDIEPGNPQNVVNPRSAKVLKIAIMSLGGFDATTVDLSTIRIGPAAAVPIRTEHRDVNGDGIVDLLLRLQARTLGVQCDVVTIGVTGTRRSMAPHSSERMKFVQWAATNDRSDTANRIALSKGGVGDKGLRTGISEFDVAAFARTLQGHVHDARWPAPSTRVIASLSLDVLNIRAAR